MNWTMDQYTIKLISSPGGALRTTISNHTVYSNHQNITQMKIPVNVTRCMVLFQLLSRPVSHCVASEALTEQFRSRLATLQDILAAWQQGRRQIILDSVQKPGVKKCIGA